MFEVRIGTKSIVIDCGLFYPHGPGSRDDRSERAEVKSARIDVKLDDLVAVLLTHAHLDHIGRLPLLTELGYKGPVHSTVGTRALAKPMLDMQLGFDLPGKREFHWSRRSEEKVRAEFLEISTNADPCAGPPQRLTVHSRACEWMQKISPRNARTHSGRLSELAQAVGCQVTLCKSCRELECDRAMRLFSTHGLSEPFPVCAGVRAKFEDAGHIPGSASIVLEVDTADGLRRLVFSGDLGNSFSTLIPGPGKCPPADALFVETTYGGSRRPDALAEQRAMRQAIGDAVRDGKIVWIPAFALDRTQKVLHQIKLGQHEGRIPEDVPVYVPSPTAHNVCAAYRVLGKAPGVFRPGLGDLDFLDIRPSASAFYEYLCTELKERKGADRSSSKSRILITTSGMMDAAFSESLLSLLLPRADVAIFTVGYTDPQSEAGQLEGDAKIVTTADGRQIDVVAQVRSFGGLSAHADLLELDSWLSAVEADATIVLVHGDPAQLEKRQQHLRSAGRQKVLVPTEGQSVRPFSK